MELSRRPNETAILAWLPEPEKSSLSSDAIIGHVPLHATSDKFRDLRYALEMYRRMGYALEYGEIENGMVSLAATSLYCATTHRWFHRCLQTKR